MLGRKDKTRFYGTFVRRIYFDGNVRKSRRRIDDSNSQREWEREVEKVRVGETQEVKMNKKDERRVLCSYKKSYISFLFIYSFSPAFLICSCWWRIHIKLFFLFIFFFRVLIKKETMLFTILIERWRAAAVAALGGLGGWADVETFLACPSCLRRVYSGTEKLWV